MAQYIFFDLDGTLTDSGPGIIHSVLYALERMGRPEPDVEKVRRTFIGPPLTVSFHSLYGYTPQQCQQAIAYFREDYNHKGIYNNRPYDGIPELLHDLKAAGKTLAVATSKPYQLAERVLEHFDLRQYFDLVCGGSMDETRNEKALIIQDAIQALHLTDLSQAVMVGDRNLDVLGAHKNGLRCIGILYGGYGTREDLESAKADWLAADPAEVGRILLG